MKRKFFLIILMFVFICSSVCLADSGISSTIPTEIYNKIPNPTYVTENINKPYPTNKWFNSIIYNSHNKTSLKMYTFPQVVECGSSSLLIEKPNVKFSAPVNNNKYQINYGVDPYENRKYDEYANMIKVTAYTNFIESENKLTDPIKTNNNGVKLDGYSDWAATAMWQDDTASSTYMKATFGKGFLFTYFEFSNIYPAIECPYDWNLYWDGTTSPSTPMYTLYDTKTGAEIDNSLSHFTGDSILLKIHLKKDNVYKDIFYGIFFNKEVEFFEEQLVIDNARWAKIYFKFQNPENKNYMSIALLPSTSLEDAKKDIREYYKYAYNFVSKTTVNWSVKQQNNSKYAVTDFNFAFEQKRAGETSTIFADVETLKETIVFDNYKDKTLFCLLPHQYKEEIAGTQNTSLSKKEIPSTLRGNLKIYEGKSFSTENKTYGILPFFQNNLSIDVKDKISTTLITDKKLSIKPDTEKKENTYYYGKNLAKIANLIPIADDLGDTDTKKYLIDKIKKELSVWFNYKGQDKNYFAYDNKWGGLLGIGNPIVFENVEDSFGTEQYNDHFFHYGYFIYASAIVSLYDKNFASEYGNVINLLIKDIANGNINDTGSYPFMRHFDFYESHSWANGMGGMHNDGIDIESSSEAMNAWAAIYMWGLATNNDYYMNLGLYLYTSEYQAIKNYFFVTGKYSSIKDIFSNAGYKKNSFGILFGGVCTYNVHWTPSHSAREIKGIQLLPMTTSLLYLGYDTDYLEAFYKEMKAETPSDYYWNDIWTRFKSMYDASEAWDLFEKNHSYVKKEIDDGGTATYTYHFIDFFKQNGIIQTGYSASLPSYLVTKKDNKIVYSAYNYTNSSQDVIFYNSTGEKIGYMTVTAKSFKSTSRLKTDTEQDRISVYPVPYKPNSSGRYGGEGIYFEGVTKGSNIKIFNVAGEKVFEQTIEESNDFLWKAKNNAGNNIASGIYFYYIKTSDGKKVKGKLAIER